MFVPLTLTAVHPLIYRALLGILVAVCVSVMAMPFFADTVTRLRGRLTHR